MVEIRFHGLDGQRAMASAELTAMAAIAQGKYAKAFAEEEPKRSEGFATACVRVSDRPIRPRKRAASPHLVVILDSALPKNADVTSGIRSDGLVIMSTAKTVSEIRRETGIQARLGVADATRSAVEINGVPVTESLVLETLIIAPRAVAKRTAADRSKGCFRGPVRESGFSPFGCSCEESLRQTAVQA